MTILDNEFTDIPTPSGPMRTHIFRPAAAGKYPGVMLFSEIFQITGPIRRTAALLAGNGFVVAAPEIFHEYEAPGTVLSYETASTERGNWCKVNKPLAQYDSDLAALREFLKNHPACTGKLGSMGLCIGGHMSFRNCFSPDVLAGACVYATDLHKLESHKRGLGLGMADDTLARARQGHLRAEILMVWGRQDPHIPYEARVQVREALETGGASYQTFETNGGHAFLRDEGPRYNPAVAQITYGLILELFKRKLGQGDLPAQPAS